MCCKREPFSFILPERDSFTLFTQYKFTVSKLLHYQVIRVIVSKDRA